MINHPSNVPGRLVIPNVNSLFIFVIITSLGNHRFTVFTMRHDICIAMTSDLRIIHVTSNTPRARSYIDRQIRERYTRIVHRDKLRNLSVIIIAYTLHRR